MDRRSLLKCLPLAAMAGLSVKVEGVDAKAFEMKPNKKYLFVMPGMPEHAARHTAERLRERGINAVVCSGDTPITIYEIEQSFTTK